MSYRTLTLFLAVLALAMFVVAPLHAEKKEGPHEVKVVKVDKEKGEITVHGKTKDHILKVAKDAKITLDGKEAKLEDLKEGDDAKVTVKDKEATEIAATTPKDK